MRTEEKNKKNRKEMSKSFSKKHFQTSNTWKKT